MTELRRVAGARAASGMELAISLSLRAGVSISAAVILLGIVWLAVTKDTGYAKVLPHDLADLLAFHQASGPAYFPTSPHEILTGIKTQRPSAIIELGILTLIATPVLRVALSVASSWSSVIGCTRQLHSLSFSYCSRA